MLYQIEEANRLLRTYLSASFVEVIDDSQLWLSLAAVPVKHNARLVWRASVLPNVLGNLIGEVERRAGDSRRDPPTWHAGVGDGRLRVFEEIDSGDDDCLLILNKLRQKAGESGGALVVEHATPSIKVAFDSWGMTEATSTVMRKLKEQLDPQNVLSPGRF